MSCRQEDKPKDIPYYYRAHNITPAVGNGWYCDDNEWIWTVRGYENEQCDAAEKESDRQAFTPATREMYGSITYNGKQYIVWTHPEHGDYITVGGVHHKLRKLWWISHDRRIQGETQTKGTFERAESKFGKGGWLPSMPSMPSLKMPSVDVKLPSLGIGTSTKAILGLVMFVFVVLLFLVALGYSGLGGAAGKAAEKRV